MKKAISISFVLLAITLFSVNWGFLVHRTVNQLAVYQLPKPMEPFFYRNLKYIVDNAPRPDLRRNEDSTEATKHFIDLEMYGDSAAWKMPVKWDDAVRIYTKDTLLKYGYVPYHIITMKNKLANAFRSLNKDSILFYATDLGHYIGDANVPLHTSANYDGQLSNQKGLHSLWESMIPEIEIDHYNLHSRHKATYLRNPEEAIWQAIRRSWSLLPDVFNQEKEATKGFTDSTKFRVQVRNGREVKSFTPEFASAYNKRLANTINEQLLHAADLIADMWYTAWVDGGSPDLSGLLSQPFDRTAWKALKKENKAYKRNQLLSKGLLLSKQQAAK